MKILSKTTRSGRVLSGLVLLFLLSIVSSPAALACHKGKPHGKDAPEICEDPPNPVVPDIIVNWGGQDLFPGIEEGIGLERRCVATQVTSDGSRGTYVCDVNENFFNYRFNEMNSSCIRCGGGNSWYCEPLTPGDFLCPDAEYSFSWTGDCTSVKGCEVEIVNRFPNPGFFHAHPYSRRTLEAYATISESTTHNPFEVEQAVQVVDMHFTYFALSTGNKLLAKCNLEPVPDWPVVLYTRPAVD